MPTPKSKRIIVLQSSNHDSESGSLRDAVADSHNESTDSDGADTLLAGYSADNGSSHEKKLKQLRPLGTQLFSSQEESGETIPVASDITLTSEPPVVGRTITVTNTHDSGAGSFRDAVADSTKVTLKNLIIANGTGGSQEEPTESGGNDLTGEDYSEASPYDTIPTGNGNDGFRSTLGIINTGNGHDFLTEFSGVSSVEATLLLLPSLQKVREAAHSSGASSSDGAWALGSTFELTSGVPFSSQTETSGGPLVRQFPGGRQHSVSPLA